MTVLAAVLTVLNVALMARIHLSSPGRRQGNLKDRGDQSNV